LRPRLRPSNISATAATSVLISWMCVPPAKPTCDAGLTPGAYAQDYEAGSDVRLGSKADIATRLTNVRFAPESGHRKGARLVPTRGGQEARQAIPRTEPSANFTGVKWVREGTAGSQ